MPRRTPGSDNRVLLVCRLLNRRRARYLITGGVAANLHGSVRDRVVRRIAGIRVLYLGLADLIRSKRTGRASDLADIEVLSGRRTH